MVTTTIFSTIFSWVLAVAPTPPTPTPQIADTTPPPAEITQGPDWARILTFDSAGDVAAEVVVWSIDDEIRIDAVFPDGAGMEATVIDGEVVGSDCIDCESATVQIEEVLAGLPEILKGSWLKCAGYAVLTVGELATGHPLLAGATAVLAACECVEAYDETEECF